MGGFGSYRLRGIEYRLLHDIELIAEHILSQLRAGHLLSGLHSSDFPFIPALVMTSKEVRATFLNFFREHQHEIVPSASVIPQDDPTLLFTNAGMNQFKPYFLGLQKPSSPRIADTQKCVRVSGKHNDLDEVGQSPYHHTFFEMLGNWSFGDYFKKEAIVWAWELMTKGYGLPKDKLYATVFETDDEAENLWRGETDIIPSHVLRCGRKDNWWSMGDTGPSGPCSELHIDRGPEYDSDPKAFVNTDSPRYIELWNLVFIQFDTQKDGTNIPLPQKHVDTGAGLERLTTVLNNLHSNYDTDLFQPIIREISSYSGVPYDSGPSGVPHRVIADHLRCLTFALGDGAMPGNEGRGHVLRSILRRASRFGRKLDLHDPFIYKLVPVLVDAMAYQFPEIKDRHVHITRVIEAEESGFGKTLDRGLEEFDRVVAGLSKSGEKMIPGDEAFKLYDTFGFHLDLTQQMAREQKMTVDVAGFEKAMKVQKSTSRSANKEVFHVTGDRIRVGETIADAINWNSGRESHYLGQEVTRVITTPAHLYKNGDNYALVLNGTPFYPESGGQVGDRGYIHGRNITMRVLDTKRYSDLRESGIPFSRPQEDDIYHVVEFDGVSPTSLAEVFAPLQEVEAVVSTEHRVPTQYNHTSTHLLQKALRTVLGEHVHQSGSLVAPDHLRFDYTHFTKPSDSELTEIERLVNLWIRDNCAVTPITTSLKEAQEEGAMALFGEKYGDEVRMIRIGEGDNIISRELCGGCHVKRTGDIGLFVIRSESSVAAGVRRIEAVTGEIARQYLYDKQARVLDELEQAETEKKKLQKELERFKSEAASAEMGSLTQKAEEFDGIRLVASTVKADSIDQLKEMGDSVRDGLGSGVGVLAAVIADKPTLVVVVTPDLVKRGMDAVPIVKELGKRLQGGGGGRPHLATAGGKNIDGIPQAIADAKTVIQKFLSECANK
jgi:alanyl-tRNA synthetase